MAVEAWQQVMAADGLSRKLRDLTFKAQAGREQEPYKLPKPTPVMYFL